MNNMPISSHKSIAIWLFSCCGLIFAMVLIGAITRLTESGLSMVEWRPLIGALPPLSDAEWARVFDLYKQSPQFEKVHFWMGIEDFKAIFFWEWFHRLLGRMIGMAYGLPLLWFAIRKQIPQGYGWPLIGLLVLGGLQGYMGWFMVKSGLINVPSVSHYRLAAHLALAFLIFSLLLKTGLSLITKPKPDVTNKPLVIHLWVALGLLVCTIFWGAYTAGLDAGLIYNDTFPHMGNSIIPHEIGQQEHWITSLFENPAGVQFMHRWLAITTTTTILGFWLHAWKQNKLIWPVYALATMVILQLSMGIITLLTHVAIPVAVAHQGGALITLGLLVTNLHYFKVK